MGKTISMESAGAPYAKRFICDGQIVGFTLQMASGWWGLYGCDQNRLQSGKLYPTAQRAKTAFAALQAQGEKTTKKPPPD